MVIKKIASLTALLALAIPSKALLAGFPYYVQSYDINSTQDDGTETGSGLCWQAFSDSNGVEVAMQPCQGVGFAAQSWTFSGGAPATGGSGSIGSIFVYRTKCLEVPGGIDADGTLLQITDCEAGNANQQWVASADPTNSFAINVRWANSTRCIDLTGGSQSASAPLSISTCDSSSTNQKWPVEWAWPYPAGDNFPMRFHSALQKDTARQLSVLAESESNNAAVVMGFTDEDSLDMDWVYNSDGTIKLSNDENFCLDVTDGVDENGTKLQIYTCSSGNTNQLWYINEDYTFQWRGSTRCIDLTNGQLNTGNQLQIWTCDNTNNNQLWKIEPIE